MPFSIAILVRMTGSLQTPKSKNSLFILLVVAPSFDHPYYSTAVFLAKSKRAKVLSLSLVHDKFHLDSSSLFLLFFFFQVWCNWLSESLSRNFLQQLTKNLLLLLRLVTPGSLLVGSVRDFSWLLRQNDARVTDLDGDRATLCE